MRIGIYGGTFNPIHLAHLRVAEEIADAFDLARVTFIPAATPPHKAGHGNLLFPHRYRMVESAVKGNPRFAVSDMEGKRGGKSYSIETLQALRKEFPEDEFFFIMGSDSFADMGTWREPEAIFASCNIVVTERPGTSIKGLISALPVDIARQFCYYEAEKRLAHSSGYSVYFFEGTPLGISSSAIREQVGLGRSIKYLTPETVESYIIERGLYRDAH